MAKLTELSSKNHQNLHVVPSATMQFASEQHVLNLTAIELAKAATCFPVFISRSSANGKLAFSAMTSFELNQNLYVTNGKWNGGYQPNALRTYPLFLMQSQKGENQFCIGFDEQSSAFSTVQGAPLFENDGAATPHLAEVTKMLEVELEHIRQSYEFAKALESMNLLKEIDIKVQYQDGTVNVIQGLCTINEDALSILNGEQLEKLNKAGYLTPIYSLLISLNLLNDLINRHNALEGATKIVNVKMEVTKEFSYT
jgi:hypothetical protein